MNSNSPEDRLMDELLREQAHGPDEAFLTSIEQALDTQVARPTPGKSGSFRYAIAAAMTLAAGGGMWVWSHSRIDPSQLGKGPKSMEAIAAEKREAEMKELAALNKAIREQEAKVEEDRKVLATIVRTKGIIYRGQESIYGANGGVDEDRQASHEEVVRQSLDTQDYVDSKRDFETDQSHLQELRVKQIDLANRAGADLDSNASAMAYEPPPKSPAGIVREAQKSKEAPVFEAPMDPVLGAKLPDLADSSLSSLAASSSGSGGGKGFGKGSGNGAGLGAPGSSLSSLGGIVGGAPIRDGTIQPAPAEAPSADRYGKFIDQPWKAPTQEPLSTFSIDVDNASYSNIRRMIREGREIPRDAVRIEECINAFSYHYKAPNPGAAFAVGASLATCPWAPSHQLARISIKGREIDASQRPPSNLVFLIDVSGSMQSEDKLPLLKRSMETLVGQLNDKDHVSIVVYAGSEGVALPTTRMDSEGRAVALRTIAKLGAGGSTNGAAGIQRAYEMAIAGKIEGGVNRVILATDGDFNVGVTGQEALVEMVKERAKSGAYLTVLGFGTGNLNDSMMDAITRDGNGNYYYVDSEREGRKVFLQNLTSTLVTIAKDVKIQVEFNPAKVGSYRLIGYANRVLRNEDFDNDKVDAGDIGAGHTVTAFYELSPVPAEGALKYQPAPQATTSDEWLSVKLRYKHPDGDDSTKIEFALTGEVPSIDKADADFQFAAGVAMFGMKLRGMDECRGAAWDKVLALANPGLANDPNEDRAEFASLVKVLKGRDHDRMFPEPVEVDPSNPRR